MLKLKSTLASLLIIICLFQILPLTTPVHGNAHRFPDFISIPDRSFPEDSGAGTGLVNLSYHFQDNGTKTIVYAFEQESDPWHINGLINGKMADFVQVVENWTGTAYFQVSGIDTGQDGLYGTPDDVKVLSNIFNVTVTPTNDPPLINSVDGLTVGSNKTVQLTLEEDSEYNITVDITEKDGETVEISANLTLANLEIVQADEGDPHIHFAPSNWDIGLMRFAVTATDTNLTIDTVDLEITVLNANDKPHAIIDTPQDGLVVMENVSVFFDCSRSSDDDLPYGDTLSYNWRSNLSGLLATSAIFETELEVGHHKITLTVADNEGDTATAIVNITVLPGNSIEIYQWCPEEYLLLVSTSENHQTFEVWSLVSTTNLESDFKWYLDDIKIETDGPALTSEFELNLRDIDHYITHEVRVIASHSGAFTSHSWTLIFQDNKENKDPNLTPVESYIQDLNVGNRVTLEITASDPDDDPLSYQWTVDDKLQAGETGNSFEFKAAKLGIYEVKVFVSDGTAELSYTWQIAVNAPQTQDDDVNDNIVDTTTELDDQSELVSWLALAAVLIVVITILVALTVAIYLHRRPRSPEGG